MSDNEIEDVSFLPGESLHRKAVYEPSLLQRVRILICTKARLALTSVIACLIILILALLIALSHNTCDTSKPPTEPQIFLTTTAANPKDNFVSTNGKPFPYHSIRLPHNVIPTHYSLFLHPNITLSYFKGKVEIDCDVKQSTSYIIFHIKDLNITSLSVSNVNGGHSYGVNEYLEYKTNEQVYVDLKERLTSGSKVKVIVEFEGQLVSKLAGFYKSMYQTNSGEKRYIATTHFEPTDARAAFPCFDEPALKATFELTMVRDKTHKTLFNMPLLSTSDYPGGLAQDKFQTSVRMSTYLVAFIVCDYDSITNKTKRNVTVGVHTPHDSIGAASFALSVAVKVIDYYEDFFGVRYPLPKQDLVAIADFEAGAMENWGLITYRMTAILYDPKVSSARNQQWIAVVIAHELAHQWFGNLVTMEWWDDLWLNEGFATFVQYIGSSIVDLEWKMEDQFVLETQLRAEYLDCLQNSHPINLPVENPDQINELFDTITYDKGASIIRMLSNFLGEDKFKAGLTAYLNRYKFNNAKTADLWDSLSEAASQSHIGTDVRSLMRTWTEQMGYPLITMEKNGDTVTVTQSRFLLYNQTGPTKSVGEKYPSPFGYMWEVPFSYKTNKEPNKIQKMLLKDRTATIKVEPGTSWVKGNPEMYGYYRVNYDEASWKSIIGELHRYNKGFSATERSGLIDDAFLLARAGRLSYKNLFDLTEYLVQEEDYLPWATFFSNIAYIQWRLENKPIYSSYKSYMLKLLKNQLQDVTWEDEGTTLQKYLRASILTKAVRLGHPASVEKGRQFFKEWKKGNASINVNLKTTIYLAGVIYGDEEDWEMVWQAYQTETDSSEKRRLLEVLGNTRDARLLTRFLSFGLNESLVRSQDTDGVLSNVAGSPAGQVLAWRFFQRNWPEFQRRYGASSFTMNKLIKACGSGFDTQFDYDEVKTFFSSRDAGSGTMAVQQTLEKIQMNIDWSNRFEQEVTDWLQEHGQM